MDCIIALEERFVLNQGKIASNLFPYRFWERYLEIFDSVKILARFSPAENLIATPVEGNRVSLIPLPNYIGPKQYLQNYYQIKQIIAATCTKKSAYLARVPGTIGTIMIKELNRHSYPYGLEIVADVYDYFAPNSIKHPLRPFFRWWFPRQLKQQCHQACGVAYVTQSALQRRYPPHPDAFSTHYSSIDLPISAFVSTPRIITQIPSTLIIITVGSMDQMSKAHDIILKAIALSRQQGFNLKLNFVGDGRHRLELEQLAQNLGIAEVVTFSGKLPAGETVRQQLDTADLFVLPSYQEGLSRAMIEAMARGLPCIGSNVGGIPELLAAEDLVSPGDVIALADKIKAVVNNPQRMTAMSHRNLETAKNYTEDILRQRRNTFYQYLLDYTYNHHCQD